MKVAVVCVIFLFDVFANEEMVQLCCTVLG